MCVLCVLQAGLVTYCPVQHNTMQRNSVLVDDVLFSVLDLLNYRECLFKLPEY